MNTDQILETYPDIVAQAKAQWQTATLRREEMEAKLYREFKQIGPEFTATEIKALINSDARRSQAVEVEISFEQVYNAKYETLMCAKKDAQLRTAY